MAQDSLPVEYLFTINATTRGGVAIPGAPQGTRYVVAVIGGTFEGPKLKGKVAEAPGGDWLTARADGSMKLDVRVLLETDDGAQILMTYNGIGLPHPEKRLDIRTAPQFETGDERYAWLNNVQAVGVGAPVEGGVVYEVYALK